jgi:hypothetical protein
MIQAAQRFSFGVTYTDPGLDVAALIFNDTGSGLNLIATVPMINFTGNSYYGNYLQAVPASLIVQISVYTDSSYTVRDENYSQTDAEFQVVDVSQGSTASPASGDIIGFIIQDNLFS